MQRSARCRSRRELSNAYLLAKISFDTAEPSKACSVAAGEKQRAPQALKETDWNGRVPLHAALESNAPLDVVRELLDGREGKDGWPDAVQRRVDSPQSDGQFQFSIFNFQFSIFNFRFFVSFSYFLMR